MSKKLVKMLQHAHAGELAAYHAYQGHWESIRDPVKRAEVQWIQEEELEHVRLIEMMLYLLKADVDRRQDAVFTVVGKTLSRLCKVTGYFMPMLGAWLIECIGVANYEEMIKEAYKANLPWFGRTLITMCRTEIEHKGYFKTCLKPKVESDQ